MIADDIDDFASAELLENGLSDNSCASYSSDLRIFAAYLAARGVSAAGDVTREHVVGFLKESREHGLRGSTRARRTVAIRMWLRFLKTRGRIASDPAALMDPPKKERALPRTLSEAEVAAVLDGIDGGTPRDLRDRAILETLYGCGLRVSELCALRLEDVTDGGELVRIYGKGSKERLVPVGGAAGRALTAYLASARGTFTRGNATETHLFVTRLAKPFTRQGIFKIIRERSAAAGIAADRVSPRTCSRTARISARSRNCSATPTFRRLRYTPTSTAPVSPRSTASIRGTEGSLFRERIRQNANFRRG